MFDVSRADELPQIETTLVPSEIARGYDFETEMREARNFLGKLGFDWQGGEEGGFANIDTFKDKLESYKAGKGKELGVETGFIVEQVRKALELANNCFDNLGLKEKIENPDDENVYLPYHGKTHAKNTLFNGMGAWIVKVKNLSVKYNLNVDEQKKWITIGSRVLALHEMDDWWEPTAIVPSDVKERVRQMIIDDLLAEKLNPEDFDDLIRLDNFMEPVTKMLKMVQDKKKGYLITENQRKTPEDERVVNKHPEIAEALGDVVVGADFMQVLNINYQKEIPVLVEGEEIKIMAGPLALVMEMFLVMPQRILKSWLKHAGYLWTLDYKNVGVDKNFLDKVREKIANHWADLGEFNQQEMLNARNRFSELEKWVAIREKKDIL